MGPLGTIGVGDSVGHVESHAVMESFHENNKREYDIVLKAASKETHIAVILRSDYRDAMHEFEDAEMWENIRFMRKDVCLPPLRALIFESCFAAVFLNTLFSFSFTWLFCLSVFLTPPHRYRSFVIGANPD